jgi:hypothetical protein
MAPSRLSALQIRILQQLAAIEPRWTLTGGGALAGFRTFHRETRDFDLFFRGQHALGKIVEIFIARWKTAPVTTPGSLR